MKRFLSVGLLSLVLVPLSALALEGQGPRITVTGVVKEVHITQKQKFDEYGGELVIQATNGQVVTIVFTKDTEMTAEGRMSRKYLLPENISEGMQVRVRGWRVDSKSLTASLVIILNLELNPTLSGNGTIQSFGNGTISILAPDGVTKILKLTNGSEVNMNYTLYGSEALNLIGKQALYTTNPTDPSTIRILRITGLPEATRTQKPTTVDQKLR